MLFLPGKWASSTVSLLFRWMLLLWKETILNSKVEFSFSVEVISNIYFSFGGDLPFKHVSMAGIDCRYIFELKTDMKLKLYVMEKIGRKVKKNICTLLRRHYISFLQMMCDWQGCHKHLIDSPQVGHHSKLLSVSVHIGEFMLKLHSCKYTYTMWYICVCFYTIL